TSSRSRFCAKPPRRNVLLALEHRSARPQLPGFQVKLLTSLETAAATREYFRSKETARRLTKNRTAPRRRSKSVYRKIMGFLHESLALAGHCVGHAASVPSSVRHASSAPYE